MSLLDRLDAVMIQAQQLDVVPQASGDLAIEGQAILRSPLAVTPAVPMVNFEGPLVVEAADHAGSPESLDSRRTRRTPPSILTHSTQLSDSIRVGSLPFLYFCLFAQVDAPRAPTTVLFLVLFAAINTGFLIGHIENLTRRELVAA